MITAIHSLPDGLGSHLIASGTLDRGKARNRRAGAAAATFGTAGAPNSLNCVCSIGDSSAEASRTAEPSSLPPSAVITVGSAGCS